MDKNYSERIPVHAAGANPETEEEQKMQQRSLSLDENVRITSWQNRDRRRAGSIPKRIVDYTITQGWYSPYFSVALHALTPSLLARALSGAAQCQVRQFTCAHIRNNSL